MAGETGLAVTVEEADLSMELLLAFTCSLMHKVGDFEQVNDAVNIAAEAVKADESTRRKLGRMAFTHMMKTRGL